MAQNALLSVSNLRVHINQSDQELRAIDGLSFSVSPGETLGIVGESGCGKSMTALSIMGLLPKPHAKVKGGQIIFGDRDLLKLSPSDLRRVRGNQIGMIFQEPMTSLNPLLAVGQQIAESIQIHRGASSSEAMRQATELLERVGISAASTRVKSYPHHFSGGMRQRVMIAMAIACRPRLLIADEPTTALDVTIQAQILDLIDDLKREIGTAVLLITHNLGVIAQSAQRVLVMYAGRAVEQASTEQLFSQPTHPYTRGLIGSVPVLGRRAGQARARLQEIPGVVPVIDLASTGCSFISRCAERAARCEHDQPDLIGGAQHQVACHVRHAGTA